MARVSTLVQWVAPSPSCAALRAPTLKPLDDAQVLAPRGAPASAHRVASDEGGLVVSLHQASCLVGRGPRHYWRWPSKRHDKGEGKCD